MRTGNSPGGKKGILFTLSSLLLGISLLSFAYLLSEQSAKSKGTASALLQIDRATDKFSNVNEQIIRILSISVNASVRNNTVELSERLPISPQVAWGFDRLAEFESQYSDENVSINLSNLRNGSFLIQPGEIAVSHAQNFFRMAPYDSAESSGLISSYDVEAEFPAGTDGAEWDSFEGSSGNSSLPVRVWVRDENYAFSTILNGTIDKYGESRINVTSGGALVGYVRFYSAASLEIWHADNMGLKASVGLSRPAYVEANDSISVISAANRTSRPRIA